MSSFAACLVSGIAPVCVYLASAEQRITRAPLHGAWRAVGLVLAVTGVCLWSTAVSSNAAAIFASAAEWATAYVVLPYISWIKQPLSQER